MNKKQLFLLMLLSWGAGFVFRLLKRLLAKALGYNVDERMCPSCGYKTVKDVALSPSLKGQPPWAYCYCSACRLRYKHKGAGPLHPVGDEEWLKKTGLRFRAPS